MDSVSQMAPIIVATSVGISILASFTALNLCGRLVTAGTRAQRWWIAGAAVALGGGTWAMHFLGMLSMPMPASYDHGLTTLSLIVPIAASAVGFQIICRSATIGSLLSAGLLVGAGIIAMHYIGIAAMRAPGMTIRHDPLLVAASIAIALVAAPAALWLAFHTRDARQRLAASLVMGAAISGMHYTAMAGASFDMIDPQVEMGSTMPDDALVVAVACVSFFLLILALITVHFHRQLESVSARDAATLKASEERYRALTESTSDMIGLVDRNGAFTYENSSALKVLGYSSDDLLGRRPSAFVAPEAVADTLQLFRTSLDRPGEAITAELTLLHKEGGRRDFEVVATNFLDVPAISGVVLNLRDITARKVMVARLEMLSETDLLTGALNRRGFSRVAELEFERARRRGEQRTLVMVDLDHFKAVNDRYGHAAGDLVLASVADCCREQIRQTDVLARIGGEEFAILLADGNVEAAHFIITRLRNAIAASSIASIKGPVSVTASFGIAIVDPAREGLEPALVRADAALYEAKNGGRNCIRISA